MNSLRTPIIILVAVIIAFIAWLVWAHEQAPATQLPQTASVASTTTPAASPTSTTTPPQDVPTLQTVMQNIAGTWQSTDDPNYSVQITSNGTWTDSYRSANASSTTSETGTYELFTSADPDKDFTGTLVPGVTYVKVSEGSSVLYFSVVEADGNELQIDYLDRGNTLSFVKE